MDETNLDIAFGKLIDKMNQKLKGNEQGIVGKTKIAI